MLLPFHEYLHVVRGGARINQERHVSLQKTQVAAVDDGLGGVRGRLQLQVFPKNSPENPNNSPRAEPSRQTSMRA